MYSAERLSELVPNCYIKSKDDRDWILAIKKEYLSLGKMTSQKAKIAFFEKARDSPQYGCTSFIINVQ